MLSVFFGCAVAELEAFMMRHLRVPAHTGTVHMYSNTWFVSGGVVRSNVFVHRVLLSVL